MEGGPVGHKIFSPLWVAAGLLLVVLGPYGPGHARAETWPTRPIRLLNPLAAGSAPDILSRIIAERLTAALGQQVVVENRAGGANVIATQAAAHAPPDGYTLFFGTSLALAVNPHTFKSLPYDPEADFVPIALIGKSAFFVLANPDLGVSTLAELMALDKQRHLTVAVDGPKNSSGMLAAWLNKRAGMTMALVPYVTMPQGVQDTIAGRIDATVLAGLAAGPLARQGTLRALAVSSGQRLAGYEQIPAIAETLPGLEFIGWFVLAAPAGTPVAIVDRLSREMDGVLHAPALVQRLGEIGFYIDRSYTPQDTAQFVRAERQKWGEIVRTIGIEPE
jgi:tripartite-type tricarboxylate transporter receptor subunit TctC